MDRSAAPSSLSPGALARRLRELAGAERDAQVDFLLHLDEFDRRLAFREAGYDSLWTYCLRALHLREGPAGRRIGAMRVLRRFPALEGPLRDGRLCISTVTLLGPLLTLENLDDLIARAAYRTKAEVEHLVASLQPRAAPRDGLRKLPERAETAALASTAPAEVIEPPAASLVSVPFAIAPPAPRSNLGSPAEPHVHAAAAPRPEPSHPAAEVRPVSRDEWSLRVTLDTTLKAELERLKELLSHSTGGDLAAVLREAIRCGIEKHGKRKGAVRPARERRTCAAVTAAEKEATPAMATKRAGNRRHVPAAIRREVWDRDGGRCAWTSEDGRRCGSRWKLELDHVRPDAFGGEPTADNLRLTCRTHNALHAEQVFGRDHMATFCRTSSGRSSRESRSSASQGALIPG
jgi:hypothetical protein